MTLSISSSSRFRPHHAPLPLNTQPPHLLHPTLALLCSGTGDSTVGSYPLAPLFTAPTVSRSPPAALEYETTSRRRTCAEVFPARRLAGKDRRCVMVPVSDKGRPVASVEAIAARESSVKTVFVLLHLSGSSLARSIESADVLVLLLPLFFDSLRWSIRPGAWV